MKNLPNCMNRFAITSLAIVAALLLTTLPAIAQSENSAADKGLQGTWVITVSPVNCTTGSPMGHPFKSMLSFARGGTLSGTTTNALFQPGQRTDDLGIWSFVSGNTYKATSQAFILYSTPAMPPAPPISAGAQQISQTIWVTGDRFTSDANVTFFDVSGNPSGSLCATASAVRYEATLQ